MQQGLNWAEAIYGIVIALVSLLIVYVLANRSGR